MSPERELLNEWVSEYATNGDFVKVYKETMAMFAQPEQEPKIEFKYSPAKACPNKIDGSCPLHNLQCNYPKCESLSDEVLYHDRLRKKVERMKQEWIVYNLTDQLINDFFACAREELTEEGVYEN